MGQQQQPKRKCEFCGRTLQPIGGERTNGALYICDWESRKYHKKCWKKLLVLKNSKWIADKMSSIEFQNEGFN